MSELAVLAAADSKAAAATATASETAEVRLCHGSAILFFTLSNLCSQTEADTKHESGSLIWGKNKYYDCHYAYQEPDKDNHTMIKV